MDENALLEAIGQMMDTKLAQQKTEILDEVTHGVKVLLDTEVPAQLTQQKAEILDEVTHGVKVLLDTEVSAQLTQQKAEILDEVTRGVKVLLDTEVPAQLAQQKMEILEEATHRMKVLLDTEVTTKFNLLAEGQEEILRKMPSEDDMDIIDGRLDTLEAIAKKHSREIAALKKAN